MSHGEAAHERGTHNMFTGYRPSPALSFPSIGSVVSHELGSRNDLPPYVCVPNVPNEFANSGYLSSAYGPFALGADPARENFQVRDLNLSKGVDEKRFERRRSLLATVDDHFRKLEKSDALDSMDAFYQHAYKLISSQKAREAFDLSKEDDKIKEEYGKTQAGQRMLLARRLVEGGIRMITPTVPKSLNSFPVIFEAAPDALLGSSLQAFTTSRSTTKAHTTRTPQTVSPPPSPRQSLSPSSSNHPPSPSSRTAKWSPISPAREESSASTPRRKAS